MTCVISETQYAVCVFGETKEKERKRGKKKKETREKRSKKNQEVELVSTYDIGSSVAVVLRRGRVVGLAHYHLCNLFFPLVALNNVTQFVTKFLKSGVEADIPQTPVSVTVFGGMKDDPNQVREKLVACLVEVLTPATPFSLDLKSHPVSPLTLTDCKKGNVEKLALACDQTHTFTRKTIWKEGKVAETRLIPESYLLSTENLANVVPVTQENRDRVKRKTANFFEQVNALMELVKGGTFSKVDAEVMGVKVDKIQRQFCEMELVVPSFRLLRSL